MQRHLSWLVRWLVQTGDDVTVVTTRGGSLPPDSGARSVEIAGTRESRYGRAWWRGTRRFIRDSRAGRWDAILSEDGGAWAVIDALRRTADRPPIVMFRHGTTLRAIRQGFPPRRLRSVAHSILGLRDYLRHARRLGRYVDLMLCISRSIAASARREGAGPRTDVRVVPLGVDLVEYRPAEEPARDRNALGLCPELPLLLWLGRDVAGKRADFALHLFDELGCGDVPCQLALAVAGPRPKTLALVRDMQRRHSGRIHLFVDASAERVRLLCRAASVLLFPSVLAEGLPLAILESLACGVPVLAAPGDSFRDLEVFQARPDWIVVPDSLRGWADRVRALLREGIRVAARRDARLIAERYYDLRVTASLTLQAIEELIGRWPKHRPW